MKSTDFLTMPTNPIRAALERLIELDAIAATRGGDPDMTAWENAITAAHDALAAEPLDPAGGGEALLAAAPAPLEGEVGELVRWLRSTAEGQPLLSDEGYARLTRAATLLQQQAAELAALRAPQGGEVDPPAAGQRQALSPAAQAVLDAVTAELDWDARYHSHSAAAAAIRALADHAGSARHWNELRTIAAELEGADA